MREQLYWAEHSAFMDALFDNLPEAVKGFFTAATRSLVIIEAANEQEVMDLFAFDPFVTHKIVALAACARWLPYQDARRTE
jgi:hypothetical protein